MAPVADSCGMAGGSPVEVFNAGAFNATPPNVVSATAFQSGAHIVPFAGAFRDKAQALSAEMRQYAKATQFLLC